MKKFWLSALVIGTFLLYVYHKRFGDEHTVTPPGNLSVLNQQSSGASTGSSSGSTPPPNTNSNSNNSSNNSGSNNSDSNSSSQSSSRYKDGTYDGDSADAYYGNIQVRVTISGGKITDVQFLDYPHDRGTSIAINSQAMPYLKEEAIVAQNANVDIVSGATDSSLAFRQSLQSALNKASQ